MEPTVLLSHFHALVGLTTFPFQLSHKNWLGDETWHELLVGKQVGGCAGLGGEAAEEM